MNPPAAAAAPSPALRSELRAARAAIDEATRHSAALAAATAVAGAEPFRRAARVAAYRPVGGEFDPGPILAHAAATGKACYLPVLADEALRFRRVSPESRFRPNRFGIPEPADGELLGPEGLDLVFAPLVAFDARGERLGMGGGFYDRTFAFLRARGARPGRRPLFVGVAFELQQVPALAAQPWDVPLDAVVTEAGWQTFADDGSER